MKKIQTVITILFITLLTISCKKNKQYVYFKESDFKEIKEKRVKINELKELECYRMYCHLCRDSILIIVYHYGNPYHVDLYDIKNKKIIARTARRGHGPNEYLGPMECFNDEKQNYFIIHDVIKNTASIFYIDSLIKNENYFPEIIKVPEYTQDIAILDSNFLVGYNGYYTNTKKFNNNVPCLFLISRKGNDSINSMKQKPMFFTLNISSGKIFVSEKEDIIWVVHREYPRIDIYNKKLQLVKSFMGPKIEEPILELKESYNHVSFKKEYYIYSCAQILDNCLYVGYMGIYNEDYKLSLYYKKSIKLFKINSKGKLLTIYNLDRNIHYFTLGEGGKKLYAHLLDHTFSTYCPVQIGIYDLE